MSSKPSPRVRSATPGDAAAIAEVNVASWHAAYRGLIDDAILDELSLPELAGEWRAAISEGGQGGSVRFWVVERAGEVFGYSRTSPAIADDLDPKRTGYVRALYVHPDEWGSGAGGMLLDHALTDLRDQGYSEAMLWAVEGNVRARRFYERAGLIPDYGPENPWFGAPQILYRIALGPAAPGSRA